MTVFPDGTKERLHGHNYQLAIEAELYDVSLAAMIPFGDVKHALDALCDEFRERVLIATQNPRYVEVRRDSELEFTLCGARYVLPVGDALSLPIDNVSVEALSAYFAERLRTALASVWALPAVASFTVSVSESPGQGAACVTALR